MGCRKMLKIRSVFNGRILIYFPFWRILICYLESWFPIQECCFYNKTQMTAAHLLFRKPTSAMECVYTYKSGFFNRKSRFFNRKSRFFTRKSRFFTRKSRFFTRKSRFFTRKSRFFTRKSRFFGLLDQLLLLKNDDCGATRLAGGFHREWPVI